MSRRRLRSGSAEQAETLMAKHGAVFRYYCEQLAADDQQRRGRIRRAEDACMAEFGIAERSTVQRKVRAVRSIAKTLDEVAATLRRYDWGEIKHTRQMIDSAVADRLLPPPVAAELDSLSISAITWLIQALRRKNPRK